MLDFTDPEIKAGDVGSFLGISDPSFPKIIIRVMPPGGYIGPDDMLARMRQRHDLNVAAGKQVTVGFDTKMTDLEAN